MEKTELIEEVKTEANFHDTEWKNPKGNLTLTSYFLIFIENY